MSSVYDFEATNLQGKPVKLAAYKGKPLLIVNTASQCGLTPQYEGLEALYKAYVSKGLVVLGFPCNQFGGQEPGDADAIESFCQVNYGVSFPMMAKVDVNGAGAHPLYKWLVSEKPGFLGSEAIKWNFTKFLVNKEGEVIKRYAPTLLPKDLERDIEALL